MARAAAGATIWLSVHQVRPGKHGRPTARYLGAFAAQAARRGANRAQYSGRVGARPTLFSVGGFWIGPPHGVAQ